MINTTELLAELTVRLANEELIAIDTEFMWRNTYYPKLCLIQIATSNNTYLIDPLYGMDLSPLKEILEDKNIVKIFHAASHDIKILHREIGATTFPIFDTQIAAEFLGIIHQGSLKHLLSHLQIANIEKNEKLSDWSERPLSKAQQQYAKEDVKFLISCCSHLEEKLKEQQKLSWFYSESRYLIENELYQDSDPRLAYKKIKSSRKLKLEERYKLKKLAELRELVSRNKNKIPRRVISDEKLVYLSCLCNPTLQDLPNCLIKNTTCNINLLIDDILFTKNNIKVTKLKKIDMDILDKMYSKLKILSDQLSIIPQLIASKKDLKLFLKNDPNISKKFNVNWRKRLIEQIIIK